MLNDANVIIKIKEYRNYLFQLRQTCFLGIDGFEATSKSISVHISPNLAAKIARFRHYWHQIQQSI